MKKSKNLRDHAIVITPGRRLAMILILVADVGIIAWGAMAALLPSYLIGPGSEPILKAEYEGYTHLSWTELATSSPSIVGFITILFRMYGTFNVAFGLMAVAIAATAFRQGERWAWWALLVGNTIAYGSAMIFGRVVNAIGIFELSEYVGIVAVYVALAITARGISGQAKSGMVQDPRAESIAGAGHEF